MSDVPTEGGMIVIAVCRSRDPNAANDAKVFSSWNLERDKKGCPHLFKIWKSRVRKH